MSEIQTHQSSSVTKHGVKIIELRGSLDSFNVDDVVDYIKHIFNSTKEKVVVFDMSELTFITAQGIGSFVNVVSEYKNNKTIYALGMNNKIKEMFNLLGFEGCCNSIDKLEDIGKITKLFPIVVECPSCGNKINIVKSGRFDCQSCKTTVSIDKKGKIEE